MTLALQVVVRCRPLNAKERADGRKVIVQCDAREGQIRVQNPKASGADAEKVFTYDQVYGTDSEQLEVFSVTAKPIVDSVMAGYNGTIFAYGQTGTGESRRQAGTADNDSQLLTLGCGACYASNAGLVVERTASHQPQSRATRTPVQRSVALPARPRVRKQSMRNKRGILCRKDVYDGGGGRQVEPCAAWHHTQRV